MRMEPDNEIKVIRNEYQNIAIQAQLGVSFTMLIRKKCSYKINHLAEIVLEEGDLVSIDEFGKVIIEKFPRVSGVPKMWGTIDEKFTLAHDGENWHVHEN